MNKTIRKKAYAKLNLGLKTLYKRNDGYHELKMLMINIDLYDELIFKQNNEVYVKCNKNICKMEENIVFKAALLMKEKYNVKDGVLIKIKKNIPDGAGLGGGSSDAACTILALNKFWDLNLTKCELLNIASEIGSDVPFFLYSKIAIVKGRGEKIETIDADINEDIILVIPDLKCSTKRVYECHKIKESDNSIDNIVSNLNSNFEDYLFNDLEESAKSAYPIYELDAIKKDIEKLGYKKALMSGSGSAIFGIKIDKNIKKQKCVYKALKKKYKSFKILNCKTLSYCKEGIGSV